MSYIFSESSVNCLVASVGGGIGRIDFTINGFLHHVDAYIGHVKAFIDFF